MPGVMPGEIAASVFTYDTGATLAWIFELQPPACWIGRPVVAAFQPAVVALRAAPVTGNSGCLAARAQPGPAAITKAAAPFVALRAEGGSQ